MLADLNNYRLLIKQFDPPLIKGSTVKYSARGPGTSTFEHSDFRADYGMVPIVINVKKCLTFIVSDQDSTMNHHNTFIFATI